MMNSKVYGIVLQVTPFQDYHQIVTLFTPDQGVIKLISKFALTKKSSLRLEPLIVVEVIYKKGRNELLLLINASTLETNIKLRDNFDTLNSALEMISAIFKSQMPHKSSPVLFSLLLRYLQYLPKTTSPETLVASFRLKILRYEGLFSAEKICANCQMPLIDGGYWLGEAYCHKHFPNSSINLSNEETNLLSELIFSRSFICLNALKISSVLQKKIQTLFDTLLAC